VFRKLRQGGRGLERDLRASKPTARPHFVAALAERITGGRRLSRPRVAIALAGTVVLAGALAAFGGAGYAAGGAGSALSGVTSVLTLKKGDSAVNTSTPTNDQYGMGPCTLGYPDSSHLPRSQVVFNESTVLKGFSIVGTGSSTGVAAWYSDEHALLLGINPGVTPFAVQDAATKTAHAHDPSVGDTTAADPSDRPFFPAAFVTDLGAGPPSSSRAGDWQQQDDNTKAQPPQDLFGTWKSATGSGLNIGSQGDPAANSSFGPGADTPPSGIKYEKFRTEVRWDITGLKDQNGLSFMGGHTYRVQFMVHDGDQNKSGGDVGQACVNISVFG
jgi:hypothetical protein